MNVLQFTKREIQKNFFYLQSIIYEKIRGLDFSRFMEPDSLGLNGKRCYPYERSLEQLLIKTFDQLFVSNTDNLLDVGSGKGFAIFVLNRYPFNKIDGVEVSPYLVTIAQRNLTHLKVDSQIFLADATEWEKQLDSYNYFYLFNPFPAEAIEKFVKHLMESLDRNPRKSTLVYCNPTCHKILVPYAESFHIIEETIYGVKHGVYVYYLSGK